MRVIFCILNSDVDKCTFLYIQIIQLVNLDGYHMVILATVILLHRISSPKSWREGRNFIVNQLNHTNDANFTILEIQSVTSDKSVILCWPKGIRFSKRRITYLKWRHLWTVTWMLTLILFACINLSIYHQSSQAETWDLTHLCSSGLVSCIYCIYNYINTAPHHLTPHLHFLNTVNWYSSFEYHYQYQTWLWFILHSFYKDFLHKICLFIVLSMHIKL